MSSKSEIISTYNKKVMVNYMSGPHLDALPHPLGAFAILSMIIQIVYMYVYNITTGMNICMYEYNMTCMYIYILYMCVRIFPCHSVQDLPLSASYSHATVSETFLSPHHIPMPQCPRPSSLRIIFPCQCPRPSSLRIIFPCHHVQDLPPSASYSHATVSKIFLSPHHIPMPQCPRPSSLRIIFPCQCPRPSSLRIIYPCQCPRPSLFASYTHASVQDLLLSASYSHATMSMTFLSPHRIPMPQCPRPSSLRIVFPCHFNILPRTFFETSHPHLRYPTTLRINCYEFLSCLAL